MKQSPREQRDVLRFRWRGFRDIKYIARIPDGADLILWQSIKDGVHLFGCRDETRVFVLYSQPNTRALREINETEQMLLHLREALRLERIRLPQKGEDAQEVAVERARDVEAAFKNVAVLGDGLRVVDSAFEDRCR